MLTVMDEYTQECLAIVVDRKLKSNHLLETLGEQFIHKGPPAHIRSVHCVVFC